MMGKLFSFVLLIAVAGICSAIKTGQCPRDVDLTSMNTPLTTTCSGSDEDCTGTLKCCDGTCIQPVGCQYNGEMYLAGESFQSIDGCNSCGCSEDGFTFCTEMYCGPDDNDDNDDDNDDDMDDDLDEDDMDDDDDLDEIGDDIINDNEEGNDDLIEPIERDADDEFDEEDDDADLDDDDEDDEEDEEEGRMGRWKGRKGGRRGRKQKWMAKKQTKKMARKAGRLERRKSIMAANNGTVAVNTRRENKLKRKQERRQMWKLKKEELMARKMERKAARKAKKSKWEAMSEEEKAAAKSARRAAWLEKRKQKMGQRPKFRNEKRKNWRAARQQRRQNMKQAVTL